MLNTSFYNKKYNLTYIFFVITSMVLLLYLFNNSLLHYTGIISIALIIIFLGLLVVQNIQNIKSNKLFMIFIVYIGYSLFCMINNFNSKSIYVFLQQILLLSIPCIASVLKVKKKNIDLVIKLFNILYYLAITLIVVLYLIGKENKVLSVYDDTIYKAFFALSLLTLLNRKNILIKIVFYSIAFYILGERTTVIIYLIIFCYYFLSPIIFRNKKTFLIFFIINLFVAISISFVIILLYKSDFAIYLTQYSRKITGANFFSGREIVWMDVESILVEHQVFGIGLGNNVLQNLGYEITTHNIYLYLRLQGGIIMLIIFSVFMLVISLNYYNKYKKTNDKKYFLFNSFLLAIMLFLSLELFILNDFAVSWFMWLSISMGLISDENCLEHKYVSGI